MAEGDEVSSEELKRALKHLEQFYEEVFLELSSYGELRELFVVDNLCDHLIGNVYAKFYDEAAALKAYKSLEGKYYHSNLVVEEFSPIINIKDGKCYKYEEGLCEKGPYCNFLHFKEINKRLIKLLKDEMYEMHPEYKKNRFNNNNNYNKKRQRKHEHTSSESSLDKYDKLTRKRIIHKWNDEYISNKKIEEKKKKEDKLESHRSNKHQKNHKNEEYDKEQKYEKLKKKEYEEDLKKNNYENYDIKEKSKSKMKNKNKVKEIKKMDSDEEETISADALK